LTISPGGAERLSGEPAHRRPVQRGRAKEQGGVELTRKSILVWPVHTFLTTGGAPDFQADYNYISWKYATVLATTGGSFGGGPTITTSSCVSCPPLVGPCVAGCTTCVIGCSTTFGTDTFGGSENQAASIIGHELVHTTGGDECAAYTWEFNNHAATGIFQCDTTYLSDVVRNMNCKCSGICP
jgi:hypothetical protein